MAEVVIYGIGSSCTGRNGSSSGYLTIHSTSGLIPILFLMRSYFPYYIATKLLGVVPRSDTTLREVFHSMLMANKNW